MAITRVELSGSPADGRSVLVVQTATAGDIVHTAHATSLDYLYLDVANVDSVDRLVSIEFGGVTSPGDVHVMTVPAQDIIRVIPGWSLSNGLIVRAFGAATNVLLVNGFVLRQS